MEKGQNFNHPQKGSHIEVEPIRDEKDIKSILQLLSGAPRDLLLFSMGINNGIRAGDLLKIKVVEKIPFNHKISESIARKIPIVLFKPKNKASKAYKRLAGTIVGEVYKPFFWKKTSKKKINKEKIREKSKKKV